MPTPVRLLLDEAAQRELRDRYRQTRDAETRSRYQMVQLAADGYPVAQIATLVQRSRSTVTRVLARYQQEGADGVPYRRRPGRPSEAPLTWQAELERVMDLDPHTAGVPRATWTLRLLRDHLAQTTGHRTGLTTVWQALQGADYRSKRPVHSLKQKAQSQPDWPKKV